MKKIITISRQFASGGREVAKRVADLLDFSYYDNEIIELLSKESGFSKEYVEQFSEASYTRMFPITVARTFVMPLENQPLELQAAQARLIGEIGKKGNVVIVGRCADVLLKGEDTLSVFIYSSDMNSRIERCYAKVPQEKELSHHAMEKKISLVDKKRAKYYSFYTDQRWGEMKNYNLCIDTAAIDIKTIANLIVDAAKNT